MVLPSASRTPVTVGRPPSRASPTRPSITTPSRSSIPGRPATLARSAHSKVERRQARRTTSSSSARGASVTPGGVTSSRPSSRPPAAGGVDIHPRRYAIRSPVSPAQRRYLLLEQGVGAAGFNFLLNAAIAWLMFRGADAVPLWGQQSIAGDTIGTSIILPFLTCLIATRLVRGHVRSGKVAPLGWSRDTQPWLGWLQRGTLARGLVLGGPGLLVF